MLSLALHAAQLKRIPRMGWVIRGVPSGGAPENVAAHSYGVAFLTLLLLADAGELDALAALRMAIVHDLAESLIGDLPRPLRRYIPDETKYAAERTALDEILAGYEYAGALREAWEAYNAGTSAEARLVKDADRLDMLIQAYLYEQAGQRNLDDFWANTSADHFSSLAAATLYEELRALRDEGMGGA